MSYACFRYWRPSRSQDLGDSPDWETPTLMDDALAGLARAADLVSVGDEAGAWSILLQTVPSAAGRADQLKRLARTAAKIRQPALAAMLAHRALAEEPDDLQLMYLLAAQQRALGRLEDARASLEDALDSDPAVRFLFDGELSVEAIARRISATPAKLLRSAMPHLAAYGELRALMSPTQPSAETLASLRAGLDAALSRPDADPAHVNGVLSIAGFFKSSPRAWNDAVFEELALPAMLRALSAHQHDIALDTETRIYVEYVQQTETEAHFRRCFLRWIEPMRAAGRSMARRPRALPGGRRIGFVVQTPALLGHTEVLATVLEALVGAGARRIQPWVMIVGAEGSRTKFVERLERAAVPVIWLGQLALPPKRFPERLAAIRAAVETHGLSAVAWISAPNLMTYAFAAEVAPVQIWWTMKYHTLELPEIDSYVTASGSPGTRVINGRRWRVGGLAAQDWFDPAASAEAAAVRARYASFDLVFGTLGRAEKLDSPPFLAAVARILRANPRAAFLWTGRDRHRGIQALFEREGVAGRCFYVGWVNTRAYAQAIDVFLDSFPFGCGVTLIQAMAAAKPAIFLRSHENVDLAPVGTIERLISGEAGSEDDQRCAREIFCADGEQLLPMAGDPDTYVTLANSVAADAGLRARIGAANQAYVRTFLEDVDGVAQCYARHFEEAIDQHSSGSRHDSGHGRA